MQEEVENLPEKLKEEDEEYKKLISEIDKENKELINSRNDKLLTKVYESKDKNDRSEDNKEKEDKEDMNTTFNNNPLGAKEQSVNIDCL